MGAFEAFRGCFGALEGVVHGRGAVFDRFGVMIRRYLSVFDRFEMALKGFQTVCWRTTPGLNQEQSPVAMLETTF